MYLRISVTCIKGGVWSSQEKSRCYFKTKRGFLSSSGERVSTCLAVCALVVSCCAEAWLCSCLYLESMVEGDPCECQVDRSGAQWLSNVTTWLRWTTFPRTPSPVGFPLGQVPREILKGDLERREAAAFCFRTLPLISLAARPATAPSSPASCFSFSNSQARNIRLAAGWGALAFVEHLYHQGHRQKKQPGAQSIPWSPTCAWGFQHALALLCFTSIFSTNNLVCGLQALAQDAKAKFL